MKTALTIAGADPSGGAGIQSDLKTFESFGVRGLSVITALTAQNFKIVKAAFPVPPAFLTKQVMTILEEFRIDAVKIGMTGNFDNIKAIGKIIKKVRLKNIVFDTVMRSTGGYPLLDKKGMKAIKDVMPLITVVTPNLAEASILSGIEISEIKDMKRAAEAIYSFGPRYVLMKGGHLKGSPIDLLYDGKEFHSFTGKRIRGKAERFHGTGCMLSAAIAAGLANGMEIKEAVKKGKEYVEGVVRGRK